MNKKYLLYLIPLIVGYIVGHFFPISILKPNYPDTEVLTKAQYYQFAIAIIAASITFCAVLVALFKDDLREYWKKPQINVNMSTDRHTIEEFNTASESGSSSDPLIAGRYISKVEIENIGNLASLNTEIILEKLQFKEKDTNITQDIECSGKPLNWNGLDATSITLPVGAKKTISIVSISAPEKMSRPDGQSMKVPPKIVVGEVETNKEQIKGTWTAVFTIYAQNYKPTSFTVVMEWTGIWKTRLTEFNSQYQINLKKK
ncbi:hypothetical protein A1704_19320 [Chryseobacterium cucumeris]|uniref:hypothetical protein n=1 Tax=Chryseobacterium cucumeris TaxID=1813611 RepID=UPI00078721F5|nr:hypothetical protein [Chryseobacterium cucumeris]KYH03923.1 hypothetical protein A1704_19320 [Chryseobacterium cucumeris]